MPYILTSCFAYLIEMIAVAIMYLNIFNAKKNVPTVLAVGILIFTVPTALFLTVDNLYLNCIVFFIANFAFGYLMFDCSKVSALILSVILDALMLGTEFLAMNVLTVVMNTELKDYKITDFMFFLFIFISKMLYFLACQVLSHFKFLFNKNTNTKTPVWLIIYPLCTMFVCVLLWNISFNYQFSNSIKVTVIITCIMSIVAIAATYLLYNQSVKKELEVFKLQTELDRMNIDEAYYKVLDHQNEELKKIVHDEKNHLTVIKSLTDNEEISNYVDEIYNNLKRYSTSGNTNNKMLDLIINKYRLLCEADDIRFDVIIRTANLSFIENTDLTALLSNILDNAIESARKTVGRSIELSINKANNFDMLTCVNSCDTKPEEISGILKTTKSNKKTHGIGTKIIKQIVEKYNGNYEWEYDESKKEFSTYIMF